MPKIGQEELRRSARVRFCCRVDVHQRHAVWTAVTKDLSARGCRVVSVHQPRLGAKLHLTLSSDLFPEELATEGEIVWISGDEVGILFAEAVRRRDALTPAAWLERVLEHGQPSDGAARGGPRVVPSVAVGAPAAPAIPLHERRRSG